jgi:hypothetical protein
MSLRALWLCIIFLIGNGMAVDVPFVFDVNPSGVANLNSDQIELAHVSSPDLAGVPIVSSPSDNEVLEFPVTGGGDVLEGNKEKKVSELKDLLSARVEPDHPVVHHEAVVLAAKYPGDRTIDQICSIYNYLKNGADSKKGWSYVADTRGIDNFMYANETLEIGEDAGCVGAGDCDDFAILMSALVESVGGTTRIILARNNTTGGHAYTEVYLGNLDGSNSQIEEIISWLKETFDTDKIYTHIDTDTKNVWLNLDWGPDEEGNTHPGGPFYQGDKHIVLSIRDIFVKTPLKLPEKSNKLPKLASLAPDRSAPFDAGTAITWIAEANDPEHDLILYRFYLNDEPMTRWLSENKWTWNTTDYDIGDNRIEVRVRDGKHAGPEKYDDNKVVTATINAPELIPAADIETEKGPMASVTTTGSSEIVSAPAEENGLPVATSLSSISGLSQFAGNWVNMDSNTGGMPTISIDIIGASANVHAWGRCHPTDCDWGIVQAFVFAPDVSSDMVSQAQALMATFVESFKETTLFITPQGNRLSVQLYTRFTDNSGRTNYGSIEVFKKSSSISSGA